MAISAVNAAEDNLTVGDATLSEADEEVEVSSSQDVNDNDTLKAVSSDESSTLQETSSNSSSVETPAAKLTSKNIVSTYGKTVKYKVKVKDSKGNVLKKKLVTIKVNGKTYKIYTNSYGNANVYLKLPAGTYKAKYSCDGLSGSAKITFNNAYKIKVYKWKTGANIKKNSRIKVNIPNSALVKKMVKYAKKGTPLIKFKGGSGKKVFITAGVHGNELSSQIAAMKLIKYLESHPIDGTVYVMPFMNPKATAKNVRNYNGYNLNSHADTKGSVSYKTVSLIKKFNCDAYGDFHCTKPGGSPGKNVAMGSYIPTYESATLAKYIAKKSSVKYLIYKEAGTEYPGALEDVVNLNGIPAVTCEVISPHGKIASGSISKSLSMMKSFLKYSSLI